MTTERQQEAAIIIAAADKVLAKCRKARECANKQMAIRKANNAKLLAEKNVSYALEQLSGAQFHAGALS